MSSNPKTLNATQQQAVLQIKSNFDANRRGEYGVKMVTIGALARKGVVIYDERIGLALPQPIFDKTYRAVVANKDPDKEIDLIKS